MWKYRNKAPDLSNSLASSCLLPFLVPKSLGYEIAPLYTLRMRSPLLHAGGRSVSLWLRSHQLLCCAESTGTREGMYPGKADSAGNCCREVLQLQAAMKLTASSVCSSPRSPRSTGGSQEAGLPHRIRSKQPKSGAKNALLHHDTRTLQILRNKWEQDLFLQSFISGVSISWGQLEATDILQELVSQLWWELWACSCEGLGRR